MHLPLDKFTLSSTTARTSSENETLRFCNHFLIIPSRVAGKNVNYPEVIFGKHVKQHGRGYIMRKSSIFH